MITRIWHGRTRRRDSNKYLNFLLTKGTHGYRETKGNKSVKVWMRENAEHADFYTVTEWDNLDSVKRYAGPEFERAVYYPEDEGILTEFELKAQHFQTCDVSKARIDGVILKLNQLLEGDAWLGESFKKKLQHVDEHLAFLTPQPGMNSIAGLIGHCTYWKKVAICHILGDHTFRDVTIDIMNFATEAQLRYSGWDALKSDFVQTHYQLVKVLECQTDELLHSEYQSGYTFEYLLEGILQHDAYHLGQIGLILRMNS